MKEMNLQVNGKRRLHLIIVAVAILSVVLAFCFIKNPIDKKITAIDDFGFHDKMFDNVQDLTVTAGEMHYEISYEEDIKQIITQLKNIKLSKEPVSQSREEERDKTNLIAFEKYTLYFNNDFTELWCVDTVKPSFSYKILNSKTVKVAFDLISNSESTRINKSLKVTDIKTGSYLDNVSVSVNSFVLEENNHSIKIELKNNSDKQYSFGIGKNLYYKQDGELILCRTFKNTEDRRWGVNAVAQILMPNDTGTMEYSFYLDDVTKEGTYRLETEALWVEFELKK